jgi:tetratricopeptide (TPR) repeat protein
MKRSGVFMSMLLFILVASAAVQAQTSQGILNQYIADLQKNPGDYALREKIIKHVQSMRPMPKIPDKVIEYEGAAEYAFNHAKKESDYLDAAKEYEKALLIAPWLAQAYYNCGVAYEKAGKFENAMASYKLYLVASPDAKDRDAVQKRIGGLQYAQAKTSKRQAQFLEEVRLADEASAKNSHSEALMHYKKAIEIFPEHPQIDVIYFNISNQYVKTGTRIPGDLDEAYKYVQKSLDLLPVGSGRFNAQRPDRLCTKGIILNRRGDRPSACNAWKQACNEGSSSGCANKAQFCP